MSGSRERPACPVLPGQGSLSSHCVRQGRRLQRGGESSGMLPTEGSRQQRKQEKYIFSSLLAPSKALYSSSFRVSCSPVSSFSLPATPHFVLILLVFAPHSFLNPKSLSFPLNSPFSIVLPVPLCYPPPPSSLLVYHI